MEEFFNTQTVDIGLNEDSCLAFDYANSKALYIVE